MKYYLCIDETGQFENSVFKEQLSSVGGFLCSETEYSELPKIIDNALFIHNETCRKMGNPILSDSLLHFRVLHCGKDNLGEKKILYFAELGKNFIREMINAFDNKIRFICRTSGTTPLNLHPQDNYTICLIALIAGIITELQEQPDITDELIVRVAHRNRIVLSGEAPKSDENSKKYTSLFKKQITDIIQKSGILNGCKLTIEIGDASKDKDLILADILLGASVYMPALCRFKQKIYEVNRFYHISLKDRPSVLLQDMAEQGKSEEALLLALDFQNSSDKGFKKNGMKFIDANLNNIISDYQSCEKFTGLLDIHLSRILESRYTSPVSLQNIKIICTFLLKKLGGDTQNSIPVLEERCLYYLVHCEAHEGIAPEKNDESYSLKYDTFFKKNGHLIYPSLPERINKRLETKLISAQTLYFNTFLFDEVDTIFNNEITEYKNAFNCYHNSEKTDDIYARLCGTYGQSLCFLGAENNNPDLIKKGISFLEEDMDHLPDNSIYRSQGYSFITAAYWMLNDLQQCLLSFKSHFGINQKDSELGDIVFSKDPAENNSIFHYIDWIRYTEMNDRLNTKNGTISLDKKFSIYNIIEIIKQQANAYPFNLFIKWAAVMEHRAGRNRKAVELLKLIERPYKEKSVFYIMIPVISRMMTNSINKEYLYENRSLKTIDSLAARYPGFKKFARAKGLLDRREMDIEEIARLLPYYYS